MIHLIKRGLIVKGGNYLIIFHFSTAFIIVYYYLLFFLSYFIICYCYFYYCYHDLFRCCFSFIISSKPSLPFPKQSIRHPLPETPAFLRPLRQQALMRSALEGRAGDLYRVAQRGKGGAIQWLAGRLRLCSQTLPLSLQRDLCCFRENLSAPEWKLDLPL